MVGLIALGKSTAESRHEFDMVNLRTRFCKGNIYHERCSEPVEHAVGIRLRELGVLPPVSESEAHWDLIKGFKPGVRGWKGNGGDYLRRLGESTRLTPVPLPAAEDVSDNIWVRWATNNADDSRRFWDVQRSLVRSRPSFAVHQLLVASRYLEAHEARATFAEIDAEIRRALPEFF